MTIWQHWLGMISKHAIEATKMQFYGVSLVLQFSFFVTVVLTTTFIALVPENL